MSWLSKCDEIKKTDNDILELNLPGKDAAILILKEFVNASIEKGSVYFSAISSRGSRKGKDKKAKADSVNPIDSSATKGNSSRMSPTKMIDILISEKYFIEKKRLLEIIKYCKDTKGQSLDTKSLSIAMLRKVKNSSLKREKNLSDSQYEYFQ